MDRTNLNYIGFGICDECNYDADLYEFKTEYAEEPRYLCEGCIESRIGDE